MQISLITTGRKTGKPHEVTIYAYPDGDRLVVVGSYGGRPNDPDWAANLRETRHASVRRRGEEVQYRVEEVDGPERERLWKMVTDAFPLYATYQGRTERLLPFSSSSLSPARAKESHEMDDGVRIEPWLICQSRRI